jgi:hypothetical protein
MRITLDTNGIIDLEENRPSAAAIRQLIAAHNNGKITLCVSAIAASERYRDGQGEPNFGLFEQKLGEVGLVGVELLNPPGIWGVTFWDHCVWADHMQPMEGQIRQLLFPTLNVENIPGELDEQRKRRERKALNAACDILGMWCHITYHGSVFVTRDGNFHRKAKKAGLLQLGAGQILNPEDVVSHIG